MTSEHLLPANATPLERGLALAVARLDRVPVPLRTLPDPATAPAATLPFLAWSLSLDVWEPTWTDEQKRAVLRAAWELHAAKGTLAGIRRVAALAGGTLVRAVLPPSKPHLAPAMTEAERRAFLRRYPELRVYRHRDRGTKSGALLTREFMGGGGRRGVFPRVSDAVIRMAPRAFLADGGVETPLTTLERRIEVETGLARSYVEIRRPMMAGLAQFAGRFLGGRARYLADRAAADRLYAVETTQELAVSAERLARRTVSPSLEPISVLAERVALPGTSRGVMLDGGFVGAGARSAPLLTTAGDRLFDRTYLFDPERSLERRGRSLHIGAVRLGMPPFEAELRVAIRGVRSRHAAGRYVRGYMVSSPRHAFDLMVRSLRWATSARDRVLLDTRTFGEAVSGERQRAGGAIAGQWQEVK